MQVFGKEKKVTKTAVKGDLFLEKRKKKGQTEGRKTSQGRGLSWKCRFRAFQPQSCLTQRLWAQTWVFGGLRRLRGWPRRCPGVPGRRTLCTPCLWQSSRLGFHGGYNFALLPPLDPNNQAEKGIFTPSKAFLIPLHI